MSTRVLATRLLNVETCLKCIGMGPRVLTSMLDSFGVIDGLTEAAQTRTQASGNEAAFLILDCVMQQCNDRLYDNPTCRVMKRSSRVVPKEPRV